MFESLSEKVQSTFRNISGRGRIDEAGIHQAMDDVRTALLEADVHQDVVKQFCDEVVSQAIGQEVTKSLKPGEEMIGLVHQKLIELMSPPEGTSADHIMLVEPAPTIVMMCGLQGSGKTTTCGKLAAYLKQRGRSVMVAATFQRPLDEMSNS